MKNTEMVLEKVLQYLLFDKNIKDRIHFFNIMLSDMSKQEQEVFKKACENVSNNI